MTQYDVIDLIWYQIQTPGVHISLQTEIWPDWINFGRIDFRKSCYNSLTVKKFKNFNLGNYAKFNSLFANIVLWDFQIPGSRNRLGIPKNKTT